MAALVIVVGSVIEEFHRVVCVFINSGFSTQKCREFIRESRRQLLFERYLAELISPSYTGDSVKSVNSKENSWCPMEDYIEIIQGVEVSESTFYEQIEPRVVFSNSNINELKEGSCFTISGKLVVNCERFSVNLVVNNATRDVALHVNPRLPQNYIVRNCKIRDVWGAEEVTSVLPFSLSRGARFKMQILVTNTDYLISINGRHFASFRHRLPFNRVNIIEIKGDVENVNVDQDVVIKYPEILSSSAAKAIPRVTESLVRDYSKSEQSHSTFTNRESDYYVPFYGILPESLVDGKRLRVEGRVKILPHSFYINLQRGQQIWPHPVIAFHLNPRFANIGGKNIICRNSWIKGSWGNEERTEQKTDFMPGQHFTLTIVCTKATYEVYINKKLVAEYDHRIEPEIVDTIYIQGDIVLWDIALEDTPPCVFSVNLVVNNATRDVALHVNPRLPQNYIVRNCKIRDVWGAEEVTSVLPFSLSRGARFKMQILVTNTDYLISINGRHFASFRHRLPFNRVNIIEIKGDVENVNVDQDVVIKYPEILSSSAAKAIPRVTESLVRDYSKSEQSHSTFTNRESDYYVPFYGILPESLVDGKRLRVEGRVKILPHSFYINLQRGQQIWPHPVIAFHLNPRFANIGGKNIICRNSWIKGSWGNEERTEQKTDFMPGQHFTLTIVCTKATYEVYINKKLVAEYDHRIEPEIVDTIYIQGDIVLWDIALEDTPPCV